MDYTDAEKVILKMSLIEYSLSNTTLEQSYILMNKVINNTSSDELTEREKELLVGTALAACYSINSIEESWVFMAKYINRINKENN
jgi:hypothetical protein